MAGAPQITMSKYRPASGHTWAEGWISVSASHPSGHCNTTKQAAMARAVRTDRRSNSPTPAQSPRPRAWAVSPLVPMRRKPISQ